MANGEYEPTPVHQFQMTAFARANRELFDEYIRYRVHGYHSSVSFRRVFGQAECEGIYMHVKIDYVETNPYYIEQFPIALKKAKVEELWNTKISLNELLQIARHPQAKETARLNAVKELNVMCGITVVDESGKTKAGRSLDDYYKLQVDAAALPDAPETNAVH